MSLRPPDPEQNDDSNASSNEETRLTLNGTSVLTENCCFNQTGDPLAVIFKDLTFTVKIKETIAEDEPTGGKKKKKMGLFKRKKTQTVEKEILDDVTGIFRPGRLTAVMGASGAGKTTLLSVLAGNVSGGTVEGQILVNGEDFSEPGKMQRISGFVFQDDVLLPSQKVKEAIEMSALLRLPKEVSEEERVRRVAEIISLLHLKKASKTQVGDPLKKGISGGERKRTSIAMEIITNPAMLFLDEPTSGLDTFTAYTVVRALQNLAHRQGRTIISTIHQPSSEIFYLFDDLMILAEGKVVYYGPVNESIDYFGERGYRCPQYTNPSDYFFMNILSDIDGPDVLNNDPAEAGPSDPARRRQTRPVSWIPSNVRERASDRIQRLIQDWPESENYQNMLNFIDQDNNKGVNAISYKGHAPYWTQFWFLSKRASKNAIRNKNIVLVRLFQSIFIGLILGLVYMNQSQYAPDNQIRNISGVLFFIAVNQYFSSANQILAVFYSEKTVVFRELNAGYYRLSAYYWTKIIVEVNIDLVYLGFIYL